MITKIMGILFMIFGIIWSSLDKIICSSLCKTCGESELSPCFFLFLFVGIIFVLTGYSLILKKKSHK